MYTAFDVQCDKRLLSRDVTDDVNIDYLTALLHFVD